MSYAAFEARIARLNDIICTVNLLAWDARTMMPPGGIDARGHQVATLTDLARDLATGDDMRRAMDAARTALSAIPKDDIRHRALARAEAEIATLSRIPARVISEMAGLKTRAHAAWAEARATNDLAGYAPLLDRMMAMQREISAAIGGGDHPYDPLIGLYEPGMTFAELQGLYGRLKSALVPLIERTRAAVPPRDDFLARRFPVGEQKAFGLKIAQRMGYDLSRGRLDDTVHPFEISFTRNDVRITSRFRESWLPGGIFALWHEAGHGIYEQGVAPEFRRARWRRCSLCSTAIWRGRGMWRGAGRSSMVSHWNAIGPRDNGERSCRCVAPTTSARRTRRSRRARRPRIGPTSPRSDCRRTSTRAGVSIRHAQERFPTQVRSALTGALAVSRSLRIC